MLYKKSDGGAGQIVDTVNDFEVAKGQSVEFRDLSIRFGSFLAVSNISLRIPPGEFVCVFGPSGCGKTTPLDAAAGFLGSSNDGNGVLDGGVLVDDIPVRKPDISRGVVFQSSSALFPWLTVRQNVAYGPRIRGIRGHQLRELTERYIELVGLGPAAGRFPGQLSGGMQQRVQLARVLANQPQVVFMDEPLGALDAQTRAVLQGEIERLWLKTQCTVMFITHDLDEAIKLADRIVIMSAGPGAGIKSIYKMNQSRPRDASEPFYVELRKRLWNDISEEVMKTLKIQKG